MTEQFIWCVQNEFGSGPYRGQGNIMSLLASIEAAGRLKSSKGGRPLPFYDGALKEKFNGEAVLNSKSLCGFSTLEQYHSWFNTAELRDLLHHTGYFLAKYKVEEPIWHGKTQVLFFASNARLVAVRACNASGVYPVDEVNIKSAQRFLRAKKQGRLHVVFTPGR